MRKGHTMGAREFEVTVERDGRWWVFEIPELRTGGQARNLADVEDEARGVIAAWMSIEEEKSFTVNVTVPGQAAVLEEWAAAQRDEEAAREAQARAAERRRAVVRELRVMQRFSVPDVGRVLGISKQRVYQLEKPAADAGEKIAS